jgi:glutamate-1-semialdehyde aminotransferase
LIGLIPSKDIVVWTPEEAAEWSEVPQAFITTAINEGIVLTPRGLGACSLAMTDDDIDRFINALARVLARL